MPLQDHLEVRPRRTGEILDDAWRLALSDLPLLLALSGLFLLPAVGLFLWLLTQPPPDALWARLLLPALAAGLLLLTGLGSGACQEAFHSWAEEHPPRLGECLAAACKRGLNHVTAQALMLALPLAALVWAFVPGLPTAGAWVLGFAFLALFAPVWMGGLGRHVALAAGQKNLWRAWRHSLRASGRHAGRALVVVTVRVFLLLFAAVNLHLFARFFFWAAEDLGGVNVALLRILTALDNVSYLIALFALAWWLLAPYAEAVHYLFFIDARMRYEGLDLWYRVEELFPVEKTPTQPGPAEPSKGPPKVLVPVLALLALLPPSRAAAGDPLTVVRAARREVAAVRREVKETTPHRGGQRWVGALRRVGERLDSQGGRQGGYRWYHRAVEGFADLPQPQALKVLDRVEGRLSLIEESLTPPEGEPLTPEQIKALVSPNGRGARPKVKMEDERPPEKEEKKKQDFENAPVFRPPAGGGLVGGAAVGAGVAKVLLFVLIGLAVAAVVVGVALLVVQWQKSRRTARPRQQGATGPEGEEFLDEPDRQDPVALWRQADELARGGNFLGAVRVLYLSVLALLHQAGLIRYERTRTNGEYADGLRPRRELHGPFCRLTGLFELKWYGERSCREADYQACRGLAEELRQGSAGEQTSA